MQRGSCTPSTWISEHLIITTSRNAWERDRRSCQRVSDPTPRHARRQGATRTRIRQHATRLHARSHVAVPPDCIFMLQLVKLNDVAYVRKALARTIVRTWSENPALDDRCYCLDAIFIGRPLLTGGPIRINPHGPKMAAMHGSSCVSPKVTVTAQIVKASMQRVLVVIESQGSHLVRENVESRPSRVGQTSHCGIQRVTNNSTGKASPVPIGYWSRRGPTPWPRAIP